MAAVTDDFIIRLATPADAEAIALERAGEIPAPIDGDPKRVRPQLRLEVPGIRASRVA